MIDCDMDFENLDRMPVLKVLLKTLWKRLQQGELDFFESNEEFLKQLTQDLDMEIQLFEHELNKDKEGEKVSKQDWKKFLDTNLPFLAFGLASGEYSPVHSFFGGIAAQEAVKFTGKFTPINHIFLHEFYTSFFKGKSVSEFQSNIESAKKHQDSRYRSHYALFGEELFTQFSEKKVLLIGAGALGCEYLKIFSMIGLCCNEKGQMTVVDDDQIEVSNLNRQFLFRSHHVGSPKCVTAVKAVTTFNGQFNVTPKQGRLQLQSEPEFTDEYWDSLDFVVNAVDNIHARKYVDKKCVLHRKSLFESGTLGTKCNSQLILPFQTECYQDSQDPEEKGIPMCTMRSFPYLIDHCIEWARS